MRGWLKLLAVGVATLLAQLLIDVGGLLFAMPRVLDTFGVADESALVEMEERLRSCNAATRWLVATYLGFGPRGRQGRPCSSDFY